MTDYKEGIIVTFSESNPVLHIGMPSGYKGFRKSSPAAKSHLIEYQCTHK